MATVPKLLTKRFEALQQLENAYDLLEMLRSSDTGTEAEQVFLQDKIDSIERVLYDGEAEAVSLINELQSDPVAWAVTRLRFIHGYTWERVGICVGLTEETARNICFRRFRQIPIARQEGWKSVCEFSAVFAVQCPFYRAVRFKSHICGAQYGKAAAFRFAVHNSVND